MKAGISSRQGGHQVAQKLTSTTLPRYSERAIAPSPRTFFSEKSGAMVPSVPAAPFEAAPGAPAGGAAAC
ncbi:hypothetical protein D3C72_2227800 [compost metagenome]